MGYNGEIVNQSVKAEAEVEAEAEVDKPAQGTVEFWKNVQFPLPNGNDNDDGSTTEPYPEPSQPTRWSTRIRNEPDWFTPVAFTRRSNRKKPRRPTRLARVRRRS